MGDIITLKDNRDFRRLYQRGRSYASPLLVTYVLKNRSGDVRIGITTGKKIIPGSVVLTILPENDPSKAIVIRDDKQNHLLAPAGILEVGTVDYINAGRITFTIATTAPFVSDLATSAYTLSLFEDVAGTPDWNGTAHGNNRFKITHQEISVDASPDILIGESDITYRS